MSLSCGTSGSKYWLFKYFWPGRVDKIGTGGKWVYGCERTKRIQNIPDLLTGLSISTAHGPMLK